MSAGNRALPALFSVTLDSSEEAFWLKFRPGETDMRTGLAVMGIAYIGAGLLHFLATPAYVRIMPSYLPAHHGLVLVSGAAEIACGMGLLLPENREGQPRRAAAWGLVLLLFAVFPANITMVTEHARFPQVPLWAAWLRLPLQIPLIWWAWRYTRTGATNPAAELVS